MKKVFGMLSLALLFQAGTACAADGFSAVHCGADVRKALTGQRMPNDRVVAIEARHQDLKLKDLGGSEVTERLFLGSWSICGSEYALLQEKDVIVDVLLMPAHSKQAPQFFGTCRADGKDVPGTVIAILRNDQATPDLAASAAWSVNEKSKRFVALPTANLRCPRDGVITADGGR